MSRIVLTLNDIQESPGPGRLFLYAKEDGSIAIRSASGEELTLADIRSSMVNVPRRIFTGRTRMTAAQAAGSYWFSDQATLAGSLQAAPLMNIHIDPADFPDIAGKSVKMRLRVQIYTNDVAPASNIVVGLYPIIRPTSGGAAGGLSYTQGTVVSGSQVAFNSMAKSGMFAGVSSDFAIPAAGHYALGLTSSAVLPANSHLHINSQVQVSN